MTYLYISSFVLIIFNFFILKKLNTVKKHLDSLNDELLKTTRSESDYRATLLNRLEEVQNLNFLTHIKKRRY